MDKETNHLNKLWKLATNRETGERYYRADKSTTLIVKEVTYNQNKSHGDLNNDHWSFFVGYQFRDALGLSFDRRWKNKEPYMVWVQSPYIYFKEGDFLYSKCGKYSVQVKMSTGVSRLKGTKVTDYGLVEFVIFKSSGKRWHYHNSHSMTQYEFLQALIYGLPEKALSKQLIDPQSPQS